jgi:hypothetical protein
MRLIAVIEDERIARRILAHLGLPTRAPPRGRRWRAQGLPPGRALADLEGVDPPSIVD